MDKISLSLNANFVAKLPNGFVGATLISVSHVIRNNAQEIMFLEKLKTSCQNVKGQINALLEENIRQMVMSMLWVVVFVEMLRKIKKIFDFILILQK